MTNVITNDHSISATFVAGFERPLAITIVISIQRIKARKTFTGILLQEYYECFLKYFDYKPVRNYFIVYKLYFFNKNTC